MMAALHTAPAEPLTDDWMSLEELCARAGISIWTGYELARADRLPIPVQRFGRQFRFSRKAYDDLRNAQHAEPRLGADG